MGNFGDRQQSQRDQFKGITITGERITSGQGSGPIVGASARVEDAGQISSRLSASRLVLLGPIGLFARKKVDKRELYLTVEGTGFSIVQKLNPDLDGVKARAFAARINSKAAAGSAHMMQAGLSTNSVGVSQITAAAQQGISSVADELTKLAELRQNGVLTDAEFAAEKAKLLNI